MDLNVAEEMFTFAVGKQLISPPKMFPWQRKFNSPPTSSKLISSFFRRSDGNIPYFTLRRSSEVTRSNEVTRLNHLFGDAAHVFGFFYLVELEKRP